MKITLAAACLAASLITTSCNNPESAEIALGTQEYNLVTGEMYESYADPSCARGTEEFEGMYFCLGLSHLENDPPEVWRAQVCTKRAAKPGEARNAVFSEAFENPVTWKVELPETQLTEEFSFTSQGSWDNCTSAEAINLRMLPCNLNTIIDATLVSQCGDESCIHRTGGLQVLRSCPTTHEVP